VPAPSPDGRAIRFVDISADQVRLRTAVHGSGRSLLLITGLGASLDLGAPFGREPVIGDGPAGRGQAARLVHLPGGVLTGGDVPVVLGVLVQAAQRATAPRNQCLLAAEFALGHVA